MSFNISITFHWFHGYVKIAVAMLWARDMGVTSTQEVTGTQLPLITVPAWGLGAHGVTPVQTYYGSPESWKNMGMLAGVANCRKSRKWDCRGRLALVFKPMHSSHSRLGPRDFGKRKNGPCGFGKKGGTTQFWWDSEPGSFGCSLCHAA